MRTNRERSALVLEFDSINRRAVEMLASNANDFRSNNHIDGFAYKQNKRKHKETKEFQQENENISIKKNA
jgi:hypothetical protein